MEGMLPLRAVMLVHPLLVQSPCGGYAMVSKEICWVIVEVRTNPHKERYSSGKEG